MTETVVQPLEEILEKSSATPAFKDATANLADGIRQDRIQFNSGSPPVKVLRLVMKILEGHPGLRIESLVVEGRSGCSDFVGRAVAQPGDVRFDFEWDCRWRAEVSGWVDAFGDPDQLRAARTFGYQCFRRISLNAE